MFFGNGDTLEQWLRKKDPQGFKTWDGHAMRVHAVRTKGQQQQEMICVVLVNKNNGIHRVYVVTPNSDRVIKGDDRLWMKFQTEYLPEGSRSTLTETETGPTLVVGEKTTEVA